MILPMMGLLFAMFTAGALGAAFLFMKRSWRRFVPFAWVPILASIGSLVLCWVLAVGLEQLFASPKAGGVGYFSGYFLGGLLGAALGHWWALRLTRRIGRKVL
jgi:peptidoglycan biosynthesis protein MviN/MurJ (putative lipid II flippase)